LSRTAHSIHPSHTHWPNSGSSPHRTSSPHPRPLRLPAFQTLVHLGRRPPTPQTLSPPCPAACCPRRVPPTPPQATTPTSTYIPLLTHMPPCYPATPRSPPHPHRTSGPLAPHRHSLLSTPDLGHSISRRPFCYYVHHTSPTRPRHPPNRLFHPPDWTHLSPAWPL